MKIDEVVSMCNSHDKGIRLVGSQLLCVKLDEKYKKKHDYSSLKRFVYMNIHFSDSRLYVRKHIQNTHLQKLKKKKNG